MKNKKINWKLLLGLGLCLLVISSCGKKKDSPSNSENPKGDTYGMATAKMDFESGETIDYKGAFDDKMLLVSMGDPEDKDYKWRLAGMATMIKGENKYLYGFTADIRGEGTYDLHVTGQIGLGSEMKLIVADKEDFGSLNGITFRPILLIDNKEKIGESTLIITSLSDTHLKGTFSAVFYNKDGEKVTITNGVVDVDIDKQG